MPVHKTPRRRLRVAIASRIFAPEPSAASFRLLALANAFRDAGDRVAVLTTTPSARDRVEHVDAPGVRIHRFPVLRDRTEYVRGYLQYMSFDIPLFFRILLGRPHDVIIAEPPPTTGFFVRLAALLRRTPYVYYAADIWSDAAESTGASPVVVRVVRWMERFAMHGARLVYSVNEGVSARAAQIAPRATLYTVGNGVDTEIFSPDGPSQPGAPYAIYSGTASEWQGATIFIEALEQVRETHPEARVVFLGHGSDWEQLHSAARRLPEGAVEFVPTVPAEQAAEWMRGATVSLASIRPDAGYSFAFPTKVFASWATGTPVIFAGEGPVRAFMAARRDDTNLGFDCDYDVTRVADAMSEAFRTKVSPEARQKTGRWASESVSLSAVAARAMTRTREVLEAR